MPWQSGLLPRVANAMVANPHASIYNLFWDLTVDGNLGAGSDPEFEEIELPLDYDAPISIADADAHDNFSQAHAEPSDHFERPGGTEAITPA